MIAKQTPASRLASEDDGPSAQSKRSWIMSRVHSEDTAPELTVRSLAHRLGYRFRLHRADLPGKPDMVFPSRKKVIFINGCFWHGHDCHRGHREPKSNQVYWRDKITRNIARDKKHEEELTALGWRALAVWECQLKDTDALKNTLVSFLEQG